VALYTYVNGDLGPVVLSVSAMLLPRQHRRQLCSRLANQTLARSAWLWLDVLVEVSCRGLSWPGNLFRASTWFHECQLARWGRLINRASSRCAHSLGSTHMSSEWLSGQFIVFLQNDNRWMLTPCLQLTLSCVSHDSQTGILAQCNIRYREIHT